MNSMVKRTLPWSINFLLFGITILIFNPAFLQVDDVYFTYIYSGLMDNTPNEFTVYVNTLYGLIFKYLYSLPVNLNFWPVSLIVISYAVSSFFYQILLKNYNFKKATIIYILFFVIAFTFILIRIQYTIIGYTCAILAYLLIFDYDNRKEKIPISVFIISILLATLSILIRKETFIATTLLFGLILTKRYLFDFQVKRIFFFSIFIVSFVVLLFAETLYLNSKPGYIEAREYVKVTETILNDPLNTNIENLSKIGWDKNDYELLAQFAFMDTDFYTLEKHKEAKEQLIHRNSFKSAWQDFFELITYYRSYLIPFLLVLLFLLILNWNKIKIDFILLAIPFLILSTYLLFFKRLPFRVIYPMIFLQLCYFLIFPVKLELSRKKSIILGIVISFAVLYRGKSLHSLNQHTHRLQYLYEEFHELVKSNEEKDFIVLNSYFSVIANGVPVFKNPNRYENQNIIINSYFIGTPTYNNALKIRGLKNLMSDLPNHPSLVLIGFNDGLRKAMKIFQRKHYNKNIKYNLIDSEYDIYSVKLDSDSD